MYSADVDGQRLIFEVAGVYRRNMIIRDRQTGTLWQHATGEALMGPLKGTQLQLLGGELTRWSKWKRMHPHTSLAVEPVPENARYPGLIPRDRLNFLLETFTTNFAASGLVRDKRLPMHEEVVGLSIEGVDKAYPLSVIQDQGFIHDRIVNTRIAIVHDADADDVNAFVVPHIDRQLELKLAEGGLSSRDGTIRWNWIGDPMTENAPRLEKLQVERQWWLGWVEFHPTSEIYRTGM